MRVILVYRKNKRYAKEVVNRGNPTRVVFLRHRPERVDIRPPHVHFFSQNGVYSASPCFSSSVRSFTSKSVLLLRWLSRFHIFKMQNPRFGLIDSPFSSIGTVLSVSPVSHTASCFHVLSTAVSPDTLYDQHPPLQFRLSSHVGRMLPRIRNSIP